MNNVKRIIAAIVAILASGAWADFYVATTGDDNATGSMAAPFQTLAKAQTAVRALLPSSSPITVWVRGGTYYLTAPLVFGTADGGSVNAPITYSSYPGEKAVLSGGIKVTTAWAAYSGNANIQMTTLAKNLKFDQLFMNGKRQVLARFPNYDTSKINDGYDANCTSPARVAKWANPTEGPGYYRGLHGSHWGGNSFIITGINSGNTIKTQWMGDNNRDNSIDASSTLVENIFEELDAPAEWYYSKTTGNLYFYPPSGVNPNTAKIELASVEELIKIAGTAATKVKYLAFKGFTITHTYRTMFMPTVYPYEGLLRGDWAVARVGAIFMQDAENVTVENCFFDQVGGNGIFISGYNRNHYIHNNIYIDVGATGVQIVGLRSAQRSPSSWIPSNHLTTIPDAAVGPKTDDYPKGIVVDNDSMYNVGTFEKQVAGVNISMSENITVRHCTIHRSPRSGININDGSWGGNIIEYNDAWDCVRGTADHGPFNSWGRDRFWSLNGYCTSGCNGAAKKPYAFLDVQSPNILRNNRFQHTGDWGIDLDDGSSNYRIYNNLCLGMGFKLREGFDRRVFNNILINRGGNFHVSYAGSNDSIFRNIIVNNTAYTFITVNIANAQTKWDYNLLWNKGGTIGGLSTTTAAGQDAHSQNADPQFTSSTNSNLRLNNYTVKSTSPALKLGFVNFPQDSFGVIRSNNVSIEARSPSISSAIPAKMVQSSSSLTLSYSLGVETPVTIEVVGLNGEVVANLVNSTESAGFHQHSWNKRTLGNSVSPRMYFVRVGIGAERNVYKVILTK